MEVPAEFYEHQNNKNNKDTSTTSAPKKTSKTTNTNNEQQRSSSSSTSSIASKFKAILLIACIVLGLLKPEGNFLKSLLPNITEVRSIKLSSYSSSPTVASDVSSSSPLSESINNNDNNEQQQQQVVSSEQEEQNQPQQEEDKNPAAAGEIDIIYKPPVMTNVGGLFFCGYDNYILAREVFPDYWERYRSGMDRGSQADMENKKFHHPTKGMRPPIQDDILVYGLHGQCATQPRSFPGKVLFVNGEPHGPNMPQNVRLPGREIGEDVYQIGLLPDTEHSILAYHGAWNMMRLDESIWANLWDHSRKPKNNGKYNALMYMNRNCVEHRETAVRRIANVIPVHYGGPCHGGDAANVLPTFQRMPNAPPGNHWTYNLESYSDYKFCLSMENSRTEHYMSEKIIIAFQAGCIPIYFGSEEVLDVFNKDAFIWYDINDPVPALRQIEYLSKNETAYQEMLNDQPIMAHGAESVKKYFSFSDRVEKGFLKNKLRRIMNLPVPYK